MLQTLIGGSGRHSLYFFEHFTPVVNFKDIIGLTFESVERNLKYDHSN